jgi:hypothetical protein
VAAVETIEAAAGRAELACENEMQDGGCDARGSNNILPATALQDGVFGFFYLHL